MGHTKISIRWHMRLTYVALCIVVSFMYSFVVDILYVGLSINCIAFCYLYIAWFHTKYLYALVELAECLVYFVFDTDIFLFIFRP